MTFPTADFDLQRLLRSLGPGKIPSGTCLWAGDEPTGLAAGWEEAEKTQWIADDRHPNLISTTTAYRSRGSRQAHHSHPPPKNVRVKRATWRDPTPSYPMDRQLDKSGEVWLETTDLDEHHEENQLVRRKQVENILALIELVRRMSTPCNLRDVGARKIDPRVLARTHQGKAGLDNTVKGLGGKGLLCCRIFRRHEVVWIHGSGTGRGSTSTGTGSSARWKLLGMRTGFETRMLNWGGYLFGEGVRKWSSLRKEAVVSTSNGTPRMSRLAAEGRKVARGPRYGLSVDRVDGGDGGGREVVGPGQRWGECYGFRRQLIDIIAIFVEGPNGEDSPTRVVGAGIQPNESIGGWWRQSRWDGCAYERATFLRFSLPSLRHLSCPSFCHLRKRRVGGEVKKALRNLLAADERKVESCCSGEPRKPIWAEGRVEKSEYQSNHQMESTSVSLGRR
ncbi:hypothetical protein C8F04DRAFT_1188224 [Mycena alexandri]|uniref:Uncharacterized protein n=1 Tax=Mycena alexandri TaxID=1745969 RepID=A0AAD6SLH7_9AGAR|nr:hypothetical protein C8F04DRAFT_1188224 [Mycena alexandri]